MTPFSSRVLLPLFVVASGAILSCGVDELPPEGQFVLHVATDAPLPLAYGQLDSGDRVPLFDRLAIEVFPPGASAPCEECAREFEVDEAMMAEGRSSVGVVPPSGAGGVRVRVRLFRGALDAPAPRPTSSLESVVLLPQAPEQGIEHLTVMLRTEEVGRAVGTLDNPVAPELGIPAESLAGTWPGASRVACRSEPASDEACIPGGPFWMGDPRLDFAGAPGYQGGNERLVVLAPFFLDRTEVTVSSFRASGLAETTSGGAVFNPQPAKPGSFCTYREQAGPGDDTPVNCLTWRLAQAYCLQQGKRLPTEAEVAYASSALGTSIYVWGDEPPACDDAVFERGATDTACAAWGTGPAPVGSGGRDRLPLSSGAVLDLAGNVSEFAMDFWQLDAEPCWGGTGVLRNPVCDVPSAVDTIGRSLRGGAFTDPPVFLRAALRTFIEGESKAVSDQVGFRCARPDG